MQNLYLGYKNLDEFKKTFSDALNKLFGKEKIDDDILMSILIIGFIDKFVTDKNKLKLIVKKAKKEIQKNLTIYDEKFQKEFIEKIFADKK